MPEAKSKRRDRKSKEPRQNFESPPGSPVQQLKRDPRELRHSPDAAPMHDDAGKQAAAPSRAVKSYSSKNAAPVLPYRSAPRSEYQQDAPRAAAPMRQGFRGLSASLPHGEGRQPDIRPGDIRTMLVGQNHTGRRV